MQYGRSRNHSEMVRSGFTIIEMAVVFAVIVVLVALLLPAVSAARSAARRITCANNLRQLGLGTANFVDAHSVFPTGLHDGLIGPAILLPMLEQASLYQKLAAREYGDVPNVPGLCCPDDSEIWTKNEAREGDSSYLMCRGTGFPKSRNGDTNGFVSNMRIHTRPADVTDGLSNTAAMAERLVIPLVVPGTTLSPDPGDPRYLWWTEQRFVLPGEEEQAADQARNHRTTVIPLGISGICKSFKALEHYDHILPPNYPGSHNGPDDYDSTRYDFARIIPASAQHSGGVQVLFADGSVQFQSVHVALPVWRAIATRNGND